MPVTVGSGVGEYNTTIQHVSNGDPANQTVFRAPSISLENRTDAIKLFVEEQETLRNAQLGASASGIQGVQGTFNTGHLHTGGDGSSLIDFQQLYNNDDDIADFQMEAGGSWSIKNSGGIAIFSVDNDTGVVSSSAGYADNSIGENTLDWGTGANQISADNVPDGVSNASVSLVQEAAWDNHVASNSDNPHGHKFLGYPFQPTGINVVGTDSDVSTEMAGQTAGGSDGIEGIVTNVAHNSVIIRDTSSDDILDAQGNKVYGRLTEDTGVWTLTFYSNIAGTETSYSFATATDILWWAQKIYAPQNRPVYSPLFEVASDQITAQVAWNAIPADMIPDAHNTRKMGDTSHMFKELNVLSVYTEPQVVTAVDLDWATGTIFTKDIVTETVFTFSNVPTTKSESITVAITNTDTIVRDVTFPTAKWPYGVEATAIDPNATTIFSFMKIGALLFASAVENFS